MVERRKPLILAKTRAIVDSVISSAKSSGKVPPPPSPLRLKAGILRFDDVDRVENNIDCFVVGVSVSVLRRLAVTAGSLVLIKNLDTNVGRVVKAIVLDPPHVMEKHECDAQPVSKVMNILPSIKYPQKVLTSDAEEVAYVSPLLAFNLGFHMSCLNLLVRSGQEHLSSFFDTEVNESNIMPNIYLQVELVPWLNLPRYASNLRVSFVKIPGCGYLDSIIGHSSIEEGDRQDLIDSALNDYFKVDRFLATGDVFCISLDWKCTPDTCVACEQQRKNSLFIDRIYFKVMGIEPSDEPVLCVNCNQTALMLGGGAPSSISPDILCADSNYSMPVQIDVVKLLGSIIAPSLCPSALSSKFKVSIFLYGSAGCGKQAVVRYVGHRLGLHVIEYNCHDFFTSSDREVLGALTNTFKAAMRYSPCVLLLHHFDAFTNLSSGDGSSSDQASIVSQVASVISEFIQPFSEDDDVSPRKMPNDGSFRLEAESSTSKRIFLVAAADKSDGLHPSIRRCFSHEISMNPLNEKQRASMLHQSVRGISKMLDKSIDDELFNDIIAQTSGFTPRDMHALVADVASSFVYRVIFDYANTVEQEDNKVTVKGFESAQDFITSSKSKAMHLDKDDFPNAIERSKKRNTSRLGTPKVPNVKWEDVGGLEEVKKTIRETIQLPLLHKDLFSSGIRKRSGLLFYGPPGTGKTLLAKAVATECSLNFLSVKGPELINMYIGESEKSVRDIFEKARAARPCVIFFDELESLAAARGASGDSGGVMDRVVSQMLTEIDGLDNSNEDLFIIGASNRADLIDPALLRPGRFDKLLYVGINTDTDSRERVLKALTRKIKLHENVTLSTIANRCPPNFTGADFYALCTDAWSIAAKRTALSSTSESDDADSVVVEINDFMQVMEDLKPSVSMAELERYESLRQQFEGPN